MLPQRKAESAVVIIEPYLTAPLHSTALDLSITNSQADYKIDFKYISTVWYHPPPISYIPDSSLYGMNQPIFFS
jgi:hypothetical protein